MRAILCLLAAGVVGCQPSEVSATWNEAEVIASDRALSIHPTPYHAQVRAEVVNRTDSTVSFYLGGDAHDGIAEGPGPSDLGRFLLIGPDTTFSMMARDWTLGWSGSGVPETRAVPAGHTLQVWLMTPSRWMMYSVGSARPRYMMEDSAAATRFFERALSRGRLVYVDRQSRDTLEVVRSPNASVSFRAPDQPSGFLSSALD